MGTVDEENLKIRREIKKLNSGARGFNGLQCAAVAGLLG